MICFHCFVFSCLHQLIPILLSEYSRSDANGFRTEEVAGKNRSGSTEQGAAIADELACHRLTNDQEYR
jgi:hypothetical protein